MINILFENNKLVQDVLNADPLLINDLIRALCYRADELNPDQTLLVFSVDKKRDFNEQADEFVAFMKRMKEIDVDKIREEIMRKK